MTTFFLPEELIHEAIADFTTEAERALAIYQATPARQRTPDERAAITELKRDLKAYARVADYWAAGVYPRAIDGIWEVASLSERGTQHHIWRENNRWACDCKAAGRGYFHVHQAMMAVIERALELAESHGLEAADTSADAYECYTPAPKRRYGYFTLPILWRGQIVGRLDPKAHRKEGRFEVKTLHLEPGLPADDALVHDLAAALREFAAWHATPEIAVQWSDPPALAARLNVALARNA
ncbi:hypothetical protein SE17_12600 [Kouleothrix aurantiaca]|uniref:Uncharacterized protein n=1 Tax=Kouleothrix aurantiaca TaxID=186479 RepID=A0A0P9D4W1_9CHLR|nr:hypothetical protein SE17_12600 [Kouleothrix aurantiaca]